MSTDRIHGEVVFTCDSCPEDLSSTETNFEQALVILREAGWALRRQHGEWTHECPDCASADQDEFD